MKGGNKKEIKKEEREVKATIDPQMDILNAIASYYDGYDLSQSSFNRNSKLETPISKKNLTLNELISETNLTKGKVLKAIKKREHEWNLPNDFIRGSLPIEEAKIERLARQERIRRENPAKPGKYRKDKAYLLMGELGLSDVVGNPDIYKGLALVIEAEGLQEMLKGVIMQGGALPEMPVLWSKTNHERAKQIVSKLDKEDITAEEIYEKYKDELKLFEKTELSLKDLEHFKNYIFGTHNTLEEAVDEGAKELAPLFAAINEKTPIIYQWSQNDFYNFKELAELIIQHQKRLEAIEEKIKEIPLFEKNLSKKRKEYASISIQQRLGEYLVKRLGHAKGKKREELKKHIKKLIIPSKGFKQEKEIIEKRYHTLRGLKRRSIDFDDIFEEILKDYLSSNNVASLEKKTLINKDRADKQLDNFKKLEDNLGELQLLEDKYEEQIRARTYFLTKKAAITNEQAKILHWAVKARYGNLIRRLFKESDTIAGKKHKVKIFSKQTVVVSKDRKHEDWVNFGLNIGLIPNPDYQRSNEPKEGDLARIMGYHENAISTAIEEGQIEPGSFADTDLIITSWGSGGLEICPQANFNEVMIEGRYRETPKRTVMVKLSVMHDKNNLKDLTKRWYGRTWAQKRFKKPGFQAGALFWIDKADRQPEFCFWDTRGLAKIGRDFYKKVSKIKEQLNQKRLKRGERTKLKKQLERVYSKISFMRDRKESRGKSKTLEVLASNDHHLGIANTPGRPSSEDSVKTTLLNVFDKGFPDFVIATESLQGDLKLASYDERATGYHRSWDGIDGRSNQKILLSKLVQEKKIRKKEYAVIDWLIEKENLEGISKWKVEDQLDLHKTIVLPFFTEAMYNGTIVVLGSGNHYNSKLISDESKLLRNLYESDLYYAGKLKIIPCEGSSDTYGEIEMPTKDKMIAGIYHKMQKGFGTDISKTWLQVQKTKSHAKVTFAAHVHHGGFVVRGGRAIYIDFGHPPLNQYVFQIGKSTSLRGSMKAYIPKDKRLIYGGKITDDVSNDLIMAWSKKAAYLEKVHKLIKKEYKKLS